MKKYILPSMIVLISAMSFNVSFASQQELIKGKELKSKTIQEIADFYKIDASEYADALSKQVGFTVLPETDFKDLNLHPSFAKGLASAVKGLDESVSDLDNDVEENNVKQDSKSESKYPFILVMIITLVFYGLTYILSKLKVITIITHRKIWNLVLTTSFLISAILGVLLVIETNFGITLPFNAIYGHVITGIVMAIVTIFHIAWHWRYFKNIFK